MQNEEEKRAWFEQHEREKRECFEQIKSSLPNVDSVSAENGEHGEAGLQKLTKTDDTEHFLTMFKTVAKTYKWPDDVWVLMLSLLLTGKAQAAYANMDILRNLKK